MSIDRGHAIYDVYSSLEAATASINRAKVSEARVVVLYPARYGLMRKDGPEFDRNRHGPIGFVAVQLGQKCPCCGNLIESFKP